MVGSTNIFNAVLYRHRIDYCNVWLLTDYMYTYADSEHAKGMDGYVSIQDVLPIPMGNSPKNQFDLFLFGGSRTNLVVYANPYVIVS